MPDKNKKPRKIKFIVDEDMVRIKAKKICLEDLMKVHQALSHTIQEQLAIDAVEEFQRD